MLLQKSMNYNSSKNLILNISLIIVMNFITISSMRSQEFFFNKKITIDVHDEKFTKILEIIEKKTQIKFCYNSDDIPLDKNITLRTKGVSLEKLLNALLKSVNLNYKIINGQVVIFNSNKSIVKDSEPEISITDDKKSNNKLSSQKVILYDTVITTIYDTLKLPVYDTLQLHDTIYIRQFDTLVYSFKNKKNKLLLKKEKKLEFYTGSYFPISNVLFSSAPQYRFISDSLLKNTSKKFSYNIGLGYIYIYENYSIYTELSFASINEQLKYYNKVENYSINNYVFVNIPFLFGYKFGKGKNFSADILGGLSLNLLIWENSKLFQLKDATYEVAYAPHSDYSLVIYSWLAGAGVNFKVSKNIDIFSHSTVQIPIRSIFSNEFYISRFQSYLLISAGINYSIK